MAGFLGIIVLIAALLVGLANLRNINATSEAVAHTYAVKVGLEHLVATLVHAETGERGFVITRGVGKGSTFVIRLPVAGPTGIFKSDPENRLATSATSPF